MQTGETLLSVKDLVVPSKVHKNNAVKGVFLRCAWEIVYVAGIEETASRELVFRITGLERLRRGYTPVRGRILPTRPYV